MGQRTGHRAAKGEHESPFIFYTTKRDKQLNNSYGRRTTELQQARERITQLEGELEDAWKEAEKLAREMDDYEADLVSDDEAVIETAEVVSLPMTPTSPRPQSVGIAPTLLNFEAITPRTPLSPRHAEPMADIPADVNGQEHNQDNISIRSAKSLRSARSIKSTRSHRSARGDATRSQYVSAARKRSYRASQGSLRLPAGHVRKQSTSRPKTPVDEHPPVPDIPLQFTSPVLSASTANASSTLLHWDSRSTSPVVFQHESADENVDGPPPAPSPRRVPANLDDISLNDDDVIEEVPRSPARKNISLDDMRLHRVSKPRGQFFYLVVVVRTISAFLYFSLCEYVPGVKYPLDMEECRHPQNPCRAC